MGRGTSKAGGGSASGKSGGGGEHDAFINEMVSATKGGMSNGDLQASVEAYAMTHKGVDENKMLDTIRDRVNSGGSGGGNTSGAITSKNVMSALDKVKNSTSSSWDAVDKVNDVLKKSKAGTTIKLQSKGMMYEATKQKDGSWMTKIGPKSADFGSYAPIGQSAGLTAGEITNFLYGVF